MRYVGEHDEGRLKLAAAAAVMMMICRDLEAALNKLKALGGPEQVEKQIKEEINDWNNRRVKKAKELMV